MTYTEKAKKFKSEYDAIKKFALYGAGVSVSITEDDVTTLGSAGITKAVSGNAWEPGLWYSVGIIVSYNNQDYEVAKEHLGLLNPEKASNLFKKYKPNKIT